MIMQEDKELTDGVIEEESPFLNGNADDTNSLSPWKRVWGYNCLPSIPARYSLAIMGFLGFVNVYALRINLSMAIIAMVNPLSTTSSIDSYNGSALGLLHYQVFDWSSTEQGYILSSFFYGYILTQLPGGYIASRFGGKYVYGIGILVTAILTLLTPLAAHIHIGALIGLRALEGVFEGVTFPAMHAIWGKWAPPKERTILVTITMSGPSVGSIIAFPLSAILSVYSGWPSVFYVFGSAAIIWFTVWLIVAFDSPSTHPRISAAERKYIETSIEEDNVLNHSFISSKTPWFHILTSPGVWAIIIVHICHNWGGYTLLTCIPSYFKDALNLGDGDLIKNGVFSGLPYVAFLLACLLTGPLADLLRNKYLPTVIVRKLFTVLSFLLTAGGMISIAYLDLSVTYTVILMTLSVGFSGLCQSAGFYSNHIDIAQPYAGILLGISNTAATVPGILGPIVAKTIAHEPAPGQDAVTVYRQEWQEVLLIAAMVYIFGAISYLILAEGERQWWAGGRPTNSGQLCNKINTGKLGK